MLCLTETGAAPQAPATTPVSSGKRDGNAMLAQVTEGGIHHAVKSNRRGQNAGQVRAPLREPVSRCGPFHP